MRRIILCACHSTSDEGRHPTRPGSVGVGEPAAAANGHRSSRTGDLSTSRSGGLVAGWWSRPGTDYRVGRPPPPARERPRARSWGRTPGLPPSGASARDVGGATGMLERPRIPTATMSGFRIAEDCRRPSSSARRRTAGSSPVTGKAVRGGGLATRETT